MDLATIFPLIVPRSYYQEGVWDLPHQLFPNSKFLLTWVFFGTETSMIYITREEFIKLNETNKEWQRIAFENLRQSIAKQENFFTHQNKRDNDQGIQFLGFLHNDGIGSSRILLEYELSSAFAEGYYVALPDRSCGMVVPKSISNDELSGVKKLIKDMYNDATTPMSDELYSSENFLLPKDWLMPIDEDFSKTMTNEINQINNKPNQPLT